MLAVQLSFVSGLMLGIEFPLQNENVKVVIDLFILRIVVWKPSQEDIHNMKNRSE